MRSTTKGLGTLAIVMMCALFSMGVSQCGGGVIYVQDGESIQDAVDAATPGTTIIVYPGFYTAAAGERAVVEVLTDDIRLIGKAGAVIDATGNDYAVKVGDRSFGCLAGAIQGFSIRGFTFQNADNSGVFLANVDNYSMTKGIYLDNAEYGPYPICSRDGVVAENFASGHDDAAIYVGQSDGTLIERNEVFDSVIGIEVENSSNAIVRNNKVEGNTAGIFLVVLPGLNIPFAENILVENNNVRDNNRVNTATDGNLALLPEGTGILNLGADFAVIRNNQVWGNRTYGIVLAGNPFSVLDPRIEPFIDGNEVRNNISKGNGYDPDVDRALAPGGDIVYSPDVRFPPTIPFPPTADPDPTDNCFDSNTFQTQFVGADAMPGATLADFPCPDAP